MDGSPLDSLVGATIGNYQIVSLLGEGGMGRVYLAEHPLIGKKVAIKVLHDGLTANPGLVKRFFVEAKAVNEIGHPNIVDILDYGTGVRPSGATFVYFTMEYLLGESLADVMERHARLPAERAIAIALQLLAALAASHKKAIVHRDLKPDNVFLVERGGEKDIVKLFDFGIAKLLGEGEGPAKTTTGAVLGTPGYMAPEQCEGRKDIDARADLYSLGVVLYEMIVGRLPFEGDGAGEVLLKQLTRPPVRPATIEPSCPPFLEAIILKAIETPRERRFQSATELAAALKARDPRLDAAPRVSTATMPPAGGPIRAVTPAAPPTARVEPRGSGGGSVLRLELAMVDRKRWSPSAFRESLVEHPLLRELVPGLVWATFDTDNRVLATFHVLDSRRYEDLQGKAVVLRADTAVGIPHPLELPAANRIAWEDLLVTFGVPQPLRQLDREVYRPAPEERPCAALTRFEGREVPAARLLSLERRGWQLGAPQADGTVGTMERALTGGGCSAVLPVTPGLSPEWIADATQRRLGRLQLQAPATARGTTPTFGELPPIAFSELIFDLALLTLSAPAG